MAASGAVKVVVVKNKKRVGTGLYYDEKNHLVVSGPLESTIEEQQIEIQLESGRFVCTGTAVCTGKAATYQITPTT